MRTVKSCLIYSNVIVNGVLIDGRTVTEKHRIEKNLRYCCLGNDWLRATFEVVSSGRHHESFRKAIEDFAEPPDINVNALCEALVVGAVSGSETLVHGVFQVPVTFPQTGCGRQHSSESGGRRRLRSRSRLASSHECVEYLLEKLRGLFARIAFAVGERPVSLGLSGGYDSRLMLALALDAGLKISAFTFRSKAHSNESAVARALAEIAGVELRGVPVRPLDSTPLADVLRNADDSLSFYDGRTNETMGSFGDVHTARVFRQCVGDAVLNLNGLGGELFRNRERLPRYFFPYRIWLRHYVVSSSARQIFKTQRAYRTFESWLAAKYAGLLREENPAFVGRLFARRWYREILLPFFVGLRLDAENRVCPSFMPFADIEIVEAALEVTPFIGAHGRVEAALIRALNPELARVRSSYGPDFSDESFRHRTSECVKAMVPISFRYARRRWLSGKTESPGIANEALLDVFREPLEYLESAGLPLDIQRMARMPEYRDRLLYVAELLFRHRVNLHVGQGGRIS